MPIFRRFGSFPWKRQKNTRRTTTKLKNFCTGVSFDPKRNFLPTYSQIRESKVFLGHPTAQSSRLTATEELLFESLQNDPGCLALLKNTFINNFT